jgi:hypothetical protein
VSLFGTKYINHPRLENLISLNKISSLHFLNGREESDAFNDKEYVKLHQSTLKKVDIIANILGRTLDDTLKTNARWTEVYGVCPKAIGELIKEHWFFSILGVLGTILGLLKYFVD